MAKKKKAPPETVNVNIRVTSAKRKRFNAACKRVDSSSSDILRMMMQDFIDGRINYTNREINVT